MATRTCRHCGGAVSVTKAKKQMILACTVCKHHEVKLFTSKGG